MKLARVSHIKCDENRASTYVWIPDGMTEEQFQNLCDLARTRYLECEGNFRANGPQYPRLDYDKHPGKTVAEIKAMHDVAVSQYESLKKHHEDSRRSFGDWLVELSQKTIEPFWKIDPPIDIDLHWGHNHGMSMEFDETNIQDLRRKSKKKPNPIFAYESDGE